MAKVIAFVDYGTVRANAAGDHLEKIAAALSYLEANLPKLSIAERVDIVARLNGLNKRGDDLAAIHKKNFATMGEVEIAGLFMRANVSTAIRSVLDVAAIKEEMGQPWVDAHSKETVSVSVRFSPK